MWNVQSFNFRSFAAIQFVLNAPKSTLQTGKIRAVFSSHLQQRNLDSFRFRVIFGQFMLGWGCLALCFIVEQVQ